MQERGRKFPPFKIRLRVIHKKRKREKKREEKEIRREEKKEGKEKKITGM